MNPKSKIQPKAGTPQIYHYLRKYQEDPKSRVFAPLAEAYRKAGLLNEAVEIARDGLRFHPHFVGGKVALARALFDQKNYQEVVKELEPVVLDVPDNLVAQKLLAESYLILGRIPEALSSYKVLMFFIPSDPEISDLVQEIESRAYEEGLLSLEKQPTLVKSFKVEPASLAIDQDHGVKRKEWIQKVERLQALLVRVQRNRWTERLSDQ